MLHQGLTAARLFFTVALNAMGLLALLAAAWLMPQFLAMILRSGLPLA